MCSGSAEATNMRRLLECENIILFGFGTGCDSIMSLVNTRGTSVWLFWTDRSCPARMLMWDRELTGAEIESKVATVIQVGGMNTLVRPDPTNDDRRAWFREVSGPREEFRNESLISNYLYSSTLGCTSQRTTRSWRIGSLGCAYARRSRRPVSRKPFPSVRVLKLIPVRPCQRGSRLWTSCPPLCRGSRRTWISA